MEPDLSKLHHPLAGTFQRLFNEQAIDVRMEQESDEQWPVVPQATPENIRFVEETERDYSKWEQVGEEWRIKDEALRRQYEELKGPVGEHKFYQSRIPKKEYDRRKEEINQNGIGTVNLYSAYEGRIMFLRVQFPDDFQHLSTKEVQEKKINDDVGYHITLGYTKDWDNNIDFRNKLTSFLDKYFHGWNGWYTWTFYRVRVTRGSTYELGGNLDFERDLQEIVKLGTGRDPHISLD